MKNIGILSIYVAAMLFLISCGSSKPDQSKEDKIGGTSHSTQHSKVAQLKDYKDLGGDFTLTDQHGKPYRLSVSNKGKPHFLYFGYTLCPDVCPTTFAKLRKVYEISGKKSSQLPVIFVTVDPERDTAKKLETYLPYHLSDAIGLTGTPEQVAEVAKAYKASFEKTDSGSKIGYLVDHTTLTYLLDAEGKVRYIFRYDDTPQFIASIISLVTF